MKPDLSIVIPLHDEASVVVELAERCAAAARSTGLGHELVLVDDGSLDGTAEIARALPPRLGARVQVLGRNRGQFRATQAGLALARGRWIVVLDGDLQDPPELIPALVSRKRQARGATAVFAVKRRREDPSWFVAGRVVFGVLQRLVGGRAPDGAGSYCLLDAGLARRVSRVRLRTANLASVASALGADGPTVPYDKAARYDRRSRVGLVGLAAEAVASLLLSSPPGRRWLVGRGADLEPR